MTRRCLSIVLAAGEGTRMRSAQPKVLHTVGGLPMVLHVLDTASKAGSQSLAVVVGAGAEKVGEKIGSTCPDAELFTQSERLGTAHAALSAASAIARGYDDIIVLFADSPLIRPETLARLRTELANGAELAVLGFRTDRPEGYGRLIEQDGQIVAIREERDATPQERAIQFCNGGIMAFSGATALADLKSIQNNNAKGEFYLTDMVETVRARGGKVVAHEGRADEILGINTKSELAAVEALWQEKRRNALMLEGVTMQAPETVYLSHDTQIGRDCFIEPNVYFGPGVTIATGVTIKAFSHLEGAEIAQGAIIGPFARLRPGTVMQQNTKIGNFCELKNARLGEGVKVNHLSYIGDSDIGENTNIGAGTITCNYDGYAKHRTDIGANAFVGSNSSLVAPVSVGQGAYVASGTVVVEDVPEDAMAIGRTRQTNKIGHSNVLRARAKEAKR